MDIWATWLDLLRSIVTTLAVDTGLGLGLAVVAATLLVRGLVLPLAFPVAYRACIRQKKLAQLEPELRALRERCRARPDAYLRELTALQRSP